MPPRSIREILGGIISVLAWSFLWSAIILLAIILCIAFRMDVNLHG